MLQEAVKLGLLLFHKASKISESGPVILETNTIRMLSLTSKNGRSLVMEADSDETGAPEPRDWVDTYRCEY
jgi:hypothetical protein